MVDESRFMRGAERNNASLQRLHHFAYCSRAAGRVDAVEVQRIVVSSQRNNPASGITGVLVFGSDVFFQWIEGPRIPIENLIASLYADPRHHDLVVLSEGEEARERIYPHWDMEQVEADDIREVLHDALDTANDPGNVAALNRILDQLDSGSLQAFGRG